LESLYYGKNSFKRHKANGGSEVVSGLMRPTAIKLAFCLKTRQVMKKHMRYLAFLAIALLIGLTVLGGTSEPAKVAPNTLANPIKIDTGYISGALIGDVGKEVRIYRGIPYAAPPVGDLRWKPPQPAAPWQGIRESTAFGKACPQSLPSGIPSAFAVPQSEDCLYLNALTPAKKASDNLPVMVWLHGGGYTMGSGTDQINNSPGLSQRGVVLVTVNMRLGPIGLLAHPLLSKESPKGVSGNYMFLDMIAALEWVQRNIAVFGGNPKNVTIFGQSGGGAKVSCLIASPLTKGLFHRGIMESGAVGKSIFPGVSMKDLESMGEKFFARLGVDKETNPLKAARALPPAKILETEAGLAKELEKEYGGLWEEAIDQQFLTDSPENIYRAGKQNPVPVIAFATLGELTGPGMVVMPDLVPVYVHHLMGVNKAGQKGYACIFDHVPSKWRQEGCVSFHGIESPFVFGAFIKPGSLEALAASFMARAAGAKTGTLSEPTDADIRVGENMQAMWVQFARTGNPNVKSLANWPAYDSATDQYLYITDPLQVKSGFSKIAQKQ
jgi:para-nitrobenzyl esterase